MALPPVGRVRDSMILALLAGCAEPWPEPPAVDSGLFSDEHEEWRSRREARAVEPPGGAVLWIGLWDLREGETSFGADSALSVVLPAEDSPLFAGSLIREGEAVRLESAPGAGIRVHEGGPVDGPIDLRHDRMEDPTRLQLGSLGLRVHSERGTDRLWLRAWDEDMPERQTFRLPEYFSVDPAWRVQARFEPYAEPEPLRVPDVTGGMVEFIARGELVFRRGRNEHRLIATAGETSSSYFVMMWDSTAVNETYQGGRYLRVDFPDESGWTTIDFNRTYNAPCVFTAYSVCGLPPRQNWLPLRVEAGEKRPS